MQTPWWFNVVTTVLGAVLAYALLKRKARDDRRHKLTGYWEAISAEIEVARGGCQGLIADGIEAPLGLLPDICYKTCFPGLLAEGELSFEDVTALTTFYGGVATINRGLDRALDAESDEARKKEYQRNKVKAKRLIKEGPAYEAAMMVIRKHHPKRAA